MLDLTKGKIHIILSQSSTIEDQLKSCIQAEILNYIYEILYLPNQVQDQNNSIAEALKNGKIV